MIWIPIMLRYSADLNISCYLFVSVGLDKNITDIFGFLYRITEALIKFLIKYQNKLGRNCES